MTAKTNRIITIANSLLIMLIALAFLLLLREITSLTLTGAKKQSPHAGSKQQKILTENDLTDYAHILKKNPFGFYAGALTSLSSKAESSGAVTDVILVGTVSGNDKYSYAIFADKNNAQEIFRPGDSVFGIGRLQRVEKDLVMINDRGTQKKIQITDIVTIREASPQAAAAGSARDSFTGDKFAKKMSESSYLVDGQKVQQAIANPNQIMTDARLLPNYVDGRQSGFTLREVRQGGIYQSLGLQNGDVLLRINDYNISNPEAALQAFTALKGLDRIQLDIVRNNSKMTMTYQIR